MSFAVVSHAGEHLLGLLKLVLHDRHKITQNCIGIIPIFVQLINDKSVYLDRTICYTKLSKIMAVCTEVVH